MTSSAKQRRRRTDAHSIAMLVCAFFVPIPAIYAWSGGAMQSQDFINGTVSQQITALGGRIDRIENMIYAVFVAMMINFVAQVIQIRRGVNGRTGE